MKGFSRVLSYREHLCISTIVLTNSSLISVSLIVG